MHRDSSDDSRDMLQDEHDPDYSLETDESRNKADGSGEEGGSPPPSKRPPPLRKSCQFCRRRKIRCVLDHGCTECRACIKRELVCDFRPKGTNDDLLPPPAAKVLPVQAHFTAPHQAPVVPAAILPSSVGNDGMAALDSPVDHHVQASSIQHIADNPLVRAAQLQLGSPAISNTLRSARASVKSLVVPGRRDTAPFTSHQPLTRANFYSSAAHPQPLIPPRSVSVPEAGGAYPYPHSFAPGPHPPAPPGTYFANSFLQENPQGSQPMFHSYSSSGPYWRPGGLVNHPSSAHPQLLAGNPSSYASIPYPTYEYYTLPTQPAYSHERGLRTHTMEVRPGALTSSTSSYTPSQMTTPYWHGSGPKQDPADGMEVASRPSLDSDASSIYAASHQQQRLSQSHNQQPASSHSSPSRSSVGGGIARQHGVDDLPSDASHEQQQRHQQTSQRMILPPMPLPLPHPREPEVHAHHHGETFPPGSYGQFVQYDGNGNAYVYAHPAIAGPRVPLTAGPNGGGGPEFLSPYLQEAAHQARLAAGVVLNNGAADCVADPGDMYSIPSE